MTRWRMVQAISLLLGCWSAILGTPSRAAPKEAQAPVGKPLETAYQYAVKVACSLRLPYQDGDLVEGTYRTVVNIHNPNEKPVTLGAKVALATDADSTASLFSVTPFRKLELPADGATKLGCFDIAGFFCPINGVCVDFAFLDGFVVIKSPSPLDVVGVYTARHTKSEVEAIDVEQIHGRKVRGEVTLTAREAPTANIKHVPYPLTPGHSDNGGGPSKQSCGGIAGIGCPEGQHCVDDPSDDCDSAKGGADCIGICVGAGETVCGTIRGLTCPKGQYCDFGLGQCKVADAQGTCKPKPSICTREYRPVCGCDGKTYGNACTAAAAGVSIDHQGQCQAASAHPCGGIAGVKCPAGQTCVDDPSDSCDPEHGGSDCPGICQNGSREAL